MTLGWLPPIRQALETLCAAHAVPLGVPVGWIEVESGGLMREVTTLDERGYFQLTPEESNLLGIDHQRQSYDSSYSMACGFKLMDYYRGRVAVICAGVGAVSKPGTEFCWRLVKLAHSMGQGATRAILHDAQTVGACETWESLRAFAVQRNALYLHQLRHSTAKWFGLVDRVFDIGKPYGLEQLLCSTPVGMPP